MSLCASTKKIKDFFQKYLNIYPKIKEIIMVLLKKNSFKKGCFTSDSSSAMPQCNIEICRNK